MKIFIGIFRLIFHEINNITMFYRIKCGKEKINKVLFFDEYLELNVSNKCKKNLFYKNITNINYGISIDNFSYYIYFFYKGKYLPIPYQKYFKILDKDKLIQQVNKFSIPINPIFGGRINIAKSIFSMEFYCSIQKKSLITIEQNQEILSLYIDGVSLQVVDIINIELNEIFQTSNPFLKKVLNKNPINIEKNFKVHILDKELTLNRGYGVFPILNYILLENEIFYSFNEKEIKTKIIELFEKYDNVY